MISEAALLAAAERMFHDFGNKEPLADQTEAVRKYWTAKALPPVEAYVKALAGVQVATDPCQPPEISFEELVGSEN